MKEIEKSKIHVLTEIIEYVPNSVVSKTIIRKITGNISVVAIDNGEALAEKNTINANGRFKMISTIIKSGYEGNTI